MSDLESNVGLNIDVSQALTAIKTLQRQISDFHSSLAKGSATANLKSLQMQQSLIDTINATGQYSAQMKTVASATQTFTTALEKNKLSMSQYFRYAGGASKSFGRFFTNEMDTIQKVAIERVKDLQTQYIKMGRDANGAIRSIAVRPLALDMDNLATKTQIAAQKQQLLNQLLKQGSTNLLNFGKNTQWAGRQLMVGFTIPLGIFGATAAKTFMQMEEQAIKFKRVYGDTFTATKETDAMLKQVQQLASEFTKYGVAVEKTMEQAAKAAATGKMGAELLAQVSEATRLSVLGNVEQSQALETTISLTNAFGTAADELRGKINFLNAVENQTVTSIEDLTTAIPKAAPVIKQLGGNVEDLAFFLTAMREGGINASESANALKSGLASLINPTKKASDFLQSFGININKIVEGNKGDVKGLVVDFAKALDTLDPLNRARAIEQLFGKFQFSRLSTLFQNVIKDGSQAAKVLELTRQSSAELGILAQRELNRISASPMYKFQKAIADFKKELAPVGEEFLKAVTPIIQFGTDMLKAFNNLDGGVKQFIVNATGLVAGLGPIFLMTFGLIANGVANIIKGFTFVKTVFNKASSASTVLGETTDYMTQQQIEAAAAAASLEQVHNKLTQAFTVETTAVKNLASAYQKAVAAQNAFTGPPAKGKAKAPKKYASGIFSVPGPKGAGDIIPAMLSPGEAVIPAKAAQKYSGFIRGMISGNIPGFSQGTEDARRKVRAAPEIIIAQVRELFKSGWLGQEKESAAMKEVAEAEANARGLVDKPGKLERTNFLSKYGFGPRTGPVDSTHINSMGDDKYFTSQNVIPDHRGLNQVFADAVEKRKGFVERVLNNPNLIAKMAAESGLSEKALRIELEKFNPLREGGAVYPTTQAGTKALLSLYENTDNPGAGTRIAAAGLRERIKVGGKAGGFIAGTKEGGKLRLDPKYDEKAIARQDEKLDKSRRTSKKKNTKAIDKNTAAVNADTSQQKKSTRTKKDDTKTQSKANATPKITIREQLDHGIVRYSGVNSRGKNFEQFKIMGPDGNLTSIKTEDAQKMLAGKGATASPKGRIKGILTGLPGKLGLGGLAAMGVGAATGNKQVSGLSDTLFQAAMLSSFIPPGTMDKMKDSLGGAKDKFMKSSMGQRYAGTRMYGKFGEATKELADFKLDAKAKVASKGLMKSLPFLAKGATMVGLRFLNMIPIVGQVALALQVVYTVATANARAQEEISKSIVETLTMTKEKLDGLNEFFGSDAKLSGIRTLSVTGEGQSGEQATLAEQFRQSEQFKNTYKETAGKLKDASPQQFALTMQSLGVDLYGQGMSEEQVQIIIDAIKKEAGQQSVVIKFKDLRLDTETGRENLAKSLKIISDGAVKEFQSNRDFLGLNFEAQAKLDEYESQMSGFISGLSQEFEKGRISSSQFEASFGDIEAAFNKAEAANPGDGLQLLNSVLMNVSPEVAQASAAISDMSTKMLVLKLAAEGAAMSTQLLADAAVGNEKAIKHLEGLDKLEKDKNKRIRQQEKIIQGISQQQQNLQKEERNLNDVYDERIKALERINQLQEQTAKQKQNQLDLADALSRGDVFAAAQAMQKIRADQAALALEQQKNILIDEKDKKAKAIQNKADSLDGALSSARAKIGDINAEQGKEYKSEINAATIEQMYKGVPGKLWNILNWQTYFADEQTKYKEFSKYIAGDPGARGNIAGTLGFMGNLGPLNPVGTLLKGGLGVYKAVKGNKETKKAAGGYISGPGSGTSDSIPARLSNGEYVIRAKAVSAIGTDALDKLNHAEKFAKGGMVNKPKTGSTASIYSDDKSVDMSDGNVIGHGLNFVMNSIYESLFGKWFVKTKHGDPTLPDAEDMGTMALNLAPIPGIKALKVAGAGAKGLAKTKTVAGAMAAVEAKKSALAAQAVAKLDKKSLAQATKTFDPSKPATAKEFEKAIMLQNFTDNSLASPMNQASMNKFGYINTFGSTFNRTPFQIASEALQQAPSEIAKLDAIEAGVRGYKDGDIYSFINAIKENPDFSKWESLGIDGNYLQNLIPYNLGNSSFDATQFFADTLTQRKQIDNLLLGGQEFLANPTFLQNIRRGLQEKNSQKAMQLLQQISSGFVSTSPGLKSFIEKMPPKIKSLIYSLMGRNRSPQEITELMHPRDVPVSTGRVSGPGSYFAVTPETSNKYYSGFGDVIHRMTMTPKAILKLLTGKGYVDSQKFAQEYMEVMGKQSSIASLENMTGNNQWRAFSSTELNGMEFDHPVIQSLIKKGYVGYRHADAFTNWLVGVPNSGFGLKPVKTLDMMGTLEKVLSGQSLGGTEKVTQQIVKKAQKLMNIKGSLPLMEQISNFLRNFAKDKEGNSFRSIFDNTPIMPEAANGGLVKFAKGGMVKRDVTSSDPGINWLNDFIQNLLGGGNPSAAMQNDSTKALLSQSYTQGAKNMGVDPTDPMFYATMFAPSMGLKGLGMAGKGVSKLKGLSSSKPSIPTTMTGFKNYLPDAYVNFMRSNPKIAVRMQSERFMDKLSKKDFEYRNRHGSRDLDSMSKPEREDFLDSLRIRADLEENVFGIRPDAPGSARPIYGAAVDTRVPWGIRGKQQNDLQSAMSMLRGKYSNVSTTNFDRYGDMSLILKNRVKKRSTFTLGDTYTEKNFNGFNGYPGQDWDGYKAAIPAPFGTKSRSQILAADSEVTKNELRFVEAQIFGGLPFSDVKRIIVRNPELIAPLRKSIAQAGLRIPVRESKLSPLGKFIKMLNLKDKSTGLPSFYVPFNKPYEIPKFKTGGMFRTPYANGGLARLHDKEFVMNAGAVKEYGLNNLKAMNSGTYTGGSVYNSYGVNINVGGSNSNANDIARTVIREIKRLDSQNIRSTKV